MSDARAVGDDVSEFLLHLAKERNDSPNTLIAYRRDLDSFVEFLGSYYGTEAWTWGGVDRLAIRGFMGHLTRRGLGKRTVGAHALGRSLLLQIPASQRDRRGEPRAHHAVAKAR